MWWLTFADDAPTPRRSERPSPKPQKAEPVNPVNTQPLDEETEEASVGDEITTMLTTLLPWAISLLLHLGIFLMAVFLIWSGAIVEEENPPVVPEARMLNDEPSELLTYSEELDTPATTEIPRDIQTQEVAKGDPLSALTTDTATDMALIGVTGSKALPAGSKIGKDPFGVGMYGVGGNARDIVYVVDASGSLIDALPFVIEELKDSFRKLSPEQRFSVIFFQRDTAIEVPVPHRGLKKATPETIRKVSDWISLDAGNIVPRGSSNPVSAIKTAIGFQPDLIYILSDNITGKGQYAVDQKDLLATIEEAKKQRGADKTRINTIQFLYPDALGTLKIIAETHKGRYRFVDESVVGTR